MMQENKNKSKATNSNTNKSDTMWNIILSLFFLVLVIFVSVVFNDLNQVLFTLSFFELLIISFATFRLIRFFTYDKIFQFVRDYFNDEKSKFKITIYELLICPWCSGLWCALFILTLFIINPITWFFIIILAISGVASFLIIFTRSL